MMANLPKQGQTTWTKRQSQTSEFSHHRRCEPVYVEELTTTRVVQQRHSVFSRCIFLSPSFFLSLSLSLCLPTTTTKAICLFQAHYYTCRFLFFRQQPPERCLSGQFLLLTASLNNHLEMFSLVVLSSRLLQSQLLKLNVSGEEVELLQL